MVGRRFISTLAVAVLASCGGSETTQNAPSATSSSARGSRGGTPVTELNLRGMIPPVPEYEGRGRNLFTYGPERRTPPPVEPRPTPPPTPRAATSTVPRDAPPRPSRLNVQYAGFVEKTESSGNKAKYAIFLDGNEILAGAEGETIANRFTVVEIGLESVTVSAEGSSATERIPLRAN